MPRSFNSAAAFASTSGMPDQSTSGPEKDGSDGKPIDESFDAAPAARPVTPRLAAVFFHPPSLPQSQLIPFDFGKVQDTGILSCFDVDSTEPCTSEAVKEQDAKSGRDSVASLLFKTGTGTGGFDFTKLDINGDEVPDTATVYSCIRDNVSGLIWEVKLPATDTPPNSAIRSGINRYSWNLADVPNNGGKGVAADARSTCPSATDCSIPWS